MTKRSNSFNLNLCTPINFTVQWAMLWLMTTVLLSVNELRNIKITTVLRITVNTNPHFHNYIEFSLSSTKNIIIKNYYSNELNIGYLIVLSVPENIGL
jgi:hypothetical protein